MFLSLLHVEHKIEFQKSKMVSFKQYSYIATFYKT